MQNQNYVYQVGGSLSSDEPCYVSRQADKQFYEALKNGEFCYVLNARQMGKSSLRVRTAQRLQAEGVVCADIDITNIGVTDVTPELWYNSIIYLITESLNSLNDFDLDTWNNRYSDLPPVLRLQIFLEKILLEQVPEHLVIFIDEIDSVLSLPFAVDDFFALIRACYNKRADNPEYRRLTFALLGVASPADLIKDKKRTPFNIGYAIDLTGFQPYEAQPLAKGLAEKSENPQEVLKAVLDWTGGQPFLTQKVCQLISQAEMPIPAGQEVAWVKQLVQTKIIDNWISQDDPQHLKTIIDRIFRGYKSHIRRLLSLYQQILLSQFLKPQEISADEEMELRLTGLVVKYKGQLCVYNKIYQNIFDKNWVLSELDKFKFLPQRAPFEATGLNPYVGLSAFQETEAAYFFGRDELIETLLEKFHNLPNNSRLLPILGPSGSGKSSVARAGLVPALQHSFNPNRLEIITPTDKPLTVLAKCLAQLWGQSTDVNDKPVEFERRLGTQTGALTEIVATLPDIEAAPLVILIDQFEEIYTLCEQVEQSTAFINNMMSAVQDNRGHLSVIVTLRSDFLAETQRHDAFNQTIASQAVIVPMMSQDDLRCAISTPAAQAGHPLDIATIDLLVNQTAEREGALPLLQFALMRLWEGLRDGIAPADTLRQIGGVGGALAQKAEQIYQGLSNRDQQLARRAFLKLIQLGDGGTKDTRRRVNLADFVAHGETKKQIHQLLNKFADEQTRLITLAGDIAEVTHEALLENWTTLKDWLAESREDLRFERRLTEAAKHWNRQNRAVGLLWHSPDLDLLAAFDRRAGQDMTAVQKAFFQASVHKQRQTKWMKRSAIVGLMVLALVSGGLASWATLERNQAEAQKKKAQASEKRAQAQKKKAQASEKRAEAQKNKALHTQSLFLTDLARQQIEKGNATNGILLTLEVLPKKMSTPDLPYVAGTRVKLHAAVFKSRERSVLQGHTYNVNHVAFSPDGTKVVTASEDNTARLWEVVSGRLLSVLDGHTEMVNHAAFSADGTKVVTASDDKTARLWEVASGRLLSMLDLHTNTVSHAAFSPDGTKVVTASMDKTARLWEVASGRLLSVLDRHKGVVYHAAFSPDGTKVVTASDDKTARLWEVASGRWLSVLDGHTGGVSHAAFSLDGTKVVTASLDKTARLWEVASGRWLSVLDGHTDIVNHAAFSADGTQVVTASLDKTARLWEVTSGRWLSVLDGHTDIVNYAGFSADGTQVVTASWDNTARLWEVASGSLLSVLDGHTEMVNQATFSADGTQVVTASLDKTARLWEVASGRLLSVLDGHKDGITHAAFSPDGTKVVTASLSLDKTARLWEVASGRLLSELDGHKDGITHAAFSPDGTKVVTASQDNTARLWEVSSGHLLSVLDGHTRWVNHAAFSQDGTKVVTASSDGTARLWQVFSSTQELIDYANQIVPRCLTPEQRKKFFLPPESPSHALIAEGEQLAKKSQIEEAVAKFKQAQQIEPCHKFHPEDKAREIAAIALIENGKQLAKQGQNSAAIVQFNKAQQIDSRFNTQHFVDNLLVTQKRDKHGNLIEKAYIDEMGNPTTHSN